MLLLLLNAASFGFSYILMSWIEYAVHRWMLHTNTVVKWFPHLEFPRRRLRDHAVRHHSDFYKCFRHEEDEEGKHAGMFIPPSFYVNIYVLLGVPMLFVDPVSAGWFALFVIGHYFVWNKFHELMHFDTSPWYLRLPGAGAWYHFVEHYHFLHHQHRNKNFNAFLPLWDLLLRTGANETELDRDVWRRVNMGEYIDRRGFSMTKRDTSL